jgi:hypothetical protein
LRGKRQRPTRLQEPRTTTKAHNKRTAGTEDYNMTDISRRERNLIPPSGGQRNDGQERMPRDGTNTGNQGEEDNINAADSSDDEPVLDCHVVIENNTSTPQNSGGTISNNRLLATSPMGKWSSNHRGDDDSMESSPTAARAAARTEH